MQFFKKVALAAFALVLGVLIAVYSDVFITVIVVASGVYMLVKGIFSLFYDRFTEFAVLGTQLKMRRLSVIRSIIGIALGIVALVAPFSFGSAAIAAVAYVVGAMMLFSAFVAAEDAYYQRKAGFDIKASILQVLLHILIAIVMFAAPQKVAFTVVKIFGIVLACISGILIAVMIITAIKARKLVKDSSAEVEIIS